MKKAFTLIELLIVVAIIAILAAIAVPNFLEAQIRSKVSRVRSDMRSLATGVEAYYIDNNQYPAAGKDGGTGLTWKPADPTAAGNVNKHVNQSTTNLASQWAPAAQQASGNKMATLTTPISYITSFFTDAFKDNKSATFNYFNDTNGWILWSVGPDADQEGPSELGAPTATNAVETVYTSTISQPSVLLLVGQNSGLTKAFTYDPTNGTVSPGDVWRVKQ